MKTFEVVLTTDEGREVITVQAENIWNEDGIVALTVPNESGKPEAVAVFNRYHLVSITPQET